MSDPARPTLDDMLCFATYAASLAFGRIYRPLLDGLGLTYPQFLVMLALWSEDGVPIGQLGERLSLETNTLTPMLKRLQGMGFLDRVRDTADERRVIVTLTEKGRAVQIDAGEITRCVAAASGLSEAQIVHLRHEMRELHRRLDAHASGKAGPGPA
ncbi:MarR family transcriptional regulator [Paracoccus sp. TOH]|uniref:MarR family winged helix-turn-helix transcriptional regulator n=1 Tax=Paracoccus sp. TOH TaxID=1263728 RepID=UPI0025B13F26|nr:MarR family transcriptional regulator [Paracoccus sp. TOH]WJS83973.1 MarR family transcriptional regulator [Paracoccus sp. TOH]